MTVTQYYEWFKREWAKAGFILSIFLVVFLFGLVRNYDLLVFVILLQTPLYMLHKTEKCVFPGGFEAYFKTKIFKLDTEDGAVNQNFFFSLNVILI